MSEENEPAEALDEKDVAEAPEVSDSDEDVGLEDLALEAGWTPKDQWKGDPGKWVSAAEHLRRTAKSAKNLAKKLTAAEQKIEAKEAEFDKRIARLEMTNSAVRKREIDQVKSYYEQQIEEAIHSQDPAQIKRALAERDQAVTELEQGEKPTLSDDEYVKAFEPTQATVQKPFWRDNAWILEDGPEADEAFADVEEMITDQIFAVTEGKRQPTPREMREALEEAEKYLSRAYRDKYRTQTEEAEDEEEEPAPKPAPRLTPRPRVPVIGSASRGGNTRNLSGRLPPEAIKAADEYIKQGLFSDRDEYARIYLSELGEKF